VAVCWIGALAGICCCRQSNKRFSSRSRPVQQNKRAPPRATGGKKPVSVTAFEIPGLFHEQTGRVFSANCPIRPPANTSGRPWARQALPRQLPTGRSGRRSLMVAGHRQTSAADAKKKKKKKQQKKKKKNTKRSPALENRRRKKQSPVGPSVGE